MLEKQPPIVNIDYMATRKEVFISTPIWVITCSVMSGPFQIPTMELA